MRKKTMPREDEEIHYGLWLLACLLNLNTSKICVVHLMEQFPVFVSFTWKGYGINYKRIKWFDVGM